MATNSQIPFNPQGNTVAITAAVVPPLGVQVPIRGSQTLTRGQYRIVNAGENPVHLGVGATALLAQTNAVAATSGNPAAGIPLLPGAVEILRFSGDVFFSGAASADTTIYLTQGEGL